MGKINGNPDLVCENRLSRSISFDVVSSNSMIACSIYFRISQQEAEMERKVQAHAHFLQEAVTASVEHMEVCQVSTLIMTLTLNKLREHMPPDKQKLRALNCSYFLYIS